MTDGLKVRPAIEADRHGIAKLVETAFGQPEEARLVDRLAADGDVVLELVAEQNATLVGHLLFSRLFVQTGDGEFPAVALAPISVAPEFQRQGIGTVLVEDGHRRLKLAGETLSIVLGEPDYYGRFGYMHEAAREFDSEFQCEALQALAWGAAPVRGGLVYAPAFSAL